MCKECGTRPCIGIFTEAVIDSQVRQAEKHLKTVEERYGISSSQGICAQRELSRRLDFKEGPFWDKVEEAKKEGK